MKIRGSKTGRILVCTPGSIGYPTVSLMANNVRRTFNVHVLVLEAFGQPRPSPRHECNHKDGNRANNLIDNLEWVTRAENQRHKFAALGRIPARGEQHGFATFTEAQVLEIRKLYSEGKTQAELGRMFNTNPIYVHKIVHRQTWRHI